MDFMNHWFSGFEKGLEKLGSQGREDLLSQCGKACSESFTLELYKKIKEQSADTEDFFKRLADEVPEIKVIETSRGQGYEIRYKECLCDLHTKGYVNCGSLCECSRQSLLYNLTTVFPDKSVRVELTDSILNGAPECVLRVSLG